MTSTDRMMMAVALLFFAASGAAADARPAPLTSKAPYPMYAGVVSSYGYSQMTGIEGKAKPALTQIMLGAIGAISFPRLKGFLLGMRSDYRMLNQHTGTDNTGSNFRGERFNYFAPALGWQLGPVTVLGDFQFLGDYVLDALMTSGSNGSFEVGYGSPLGARLMIDFPLWPIGDLVHVAVEGEYVRFSTFENYSTEQSSELTQKQLLWRAAAGLMFIL